MVGTRECPRMTYLELQCRLPYHKFSEALFLRQARDGFFSAEQLKLFIDAKSWSKNLEHLVSISYNQFFVVIFFDRVCLQL